MDSLNELNEGKTNLELIVKKSTVLTSFVENDDIEGLLQSEHFKLEYSGIDEGLCLGKLDATEVDTPVLINTLNFMFKYNIPGYQVIELYIQGKIFDDPPSSEDDDSPDYDNIIEGKEESFLLGHYLVKSNSYFLKTMKDPRLTPNLLEYFETGKNVLKFETDTFISYEWFKYIYRKEQYPKVLKVNPKLVKQEEQYLYSLPYIAEVLRDYIINNVITDYKHAKDIINNVVNDIYPIQSEKYVEFQFSRFTQVLCGAKLFDLVIELMEVRFLFTSEESTQNGSKIKSLSSLIDEELLAKYLIELDNEGYLELFYRSFSLDLGVKSVIEECLLQSESKKLIKVYNLYLHGKNWNKDRDNWDRLAAFAKERKTDSFAHQCKKVFESQFNNVSVDKLAHFINILHTLGLLYTFNSGLEVKNYSKMKELRSHIKDDKILQSVVPYHPLIEFIFDDSFHDHKFYLTKSEYLSFFHHYSGCIKLTYDEVYQVYDNLYKIEDNLGLDFKEVCKLLCSYVISDKDVEDLTIDTLRRDHTELIIMMYNYIKSKGKNVDDIFYELLTEPYNPFRDTFGLLLENMLEVAFPLNIWNFICVYDWRISYFHCDNGKFRQDDCTKFLDMLISKGYLISNQHLKLCEEEISKRSKPTEANEFVCQYIKHHISVHLDEKMVESYITNGALDELTLAFQSYGYIPSVKEFNLAKAQGMQDIVNLIEDVGEQDLAHIFYLGKFY